MGKKRVIDKPFKLDAVKYRESHPDLTLEETAKNLGVSCSSVQRWMSMYSNSNGDDTKAFRGSGNHESEEAKELARLKKENRDLKDAVEILKKAMNILNSR
jgi:transposase